MMAMRDLPLRMLVALGVLAGSMTQIRMFWSVGRGGWPGFSAADAGRG
jgi:hypothetical protein